jgi:hypothetical protein
MDMVPLPAARHDLEPAHCPFCGDELPSHTEMMSSVLDSLLPVTHSEPTPANPSARSGDLLLTMAYCNQHALDLKMRPRALAAGWPLAPDFAALPGRVRVLLDAVKTLSGSAAMAESPFYTNLFTAALEDDSNMLSFLTPGAA